MGIYSFAYATYTAAGTNLANALSALDNVSCAKSVKNDYTFTMDMSFKDSDGLMHATHFVFTVPTNSAFVVSVCNDANGVFLIVTQNILSEGILIGSTTLSNILFQVHENTLKSNFSVITNPSADSMNCISKTTRSGEAHLVPLIVGGSNTKIFDKILIAANSRSAAAGTKFISSKGETYVCLGGVFYAKEMMVE